jgi:hypothetical protein
MCACVLYAWLAAQGNQHSGATGGVHLPGLTVIDNLPIPIPCPPQCPSLDASSARPWLTAVAGTGGLEDITGSGTVKNAHGCTERVDVAPGAPKGVSVAVECDRQ